MKITVSAKGDGDYKTIQEAINALKNSKTEDTIFVREGIYREVVEILRDSITIEGENRDNTIIVFNNCANMLMEDNQKRGTFRSYTMLAVGNNVTIKNLTIKNDAGAGDKVGQAIALYAEGDYIKVFDCNIISCQDTLFVGPLPLTENKPGGLIGPTYTRPRTLLHQYYNNCTISGDVDFIFGSAVAYFDHCLIRCVDRDHPDVGGYICAPSTYANHRYGFVFADCRIEGTKKDKRFYLGRPWRDDAKAVFLRTYMDDCIIDEGIHDWNKPQTHELATWAEYQCYGPGTSDNRVPYLKQLNDEEAEEYSMENVMNYTL